MKILFLTQTYLNLYKPIETELIKQGHEVYTIADKILSFDHYYSCNFFFKRWLNGFLIKLSESRFKLYWKNRIKMDVHLQESFDFLLVINGYSFHPYFLDFLKMRNRNIRSCLYIWDSNKYYNFFRHLPYFDKVLTFDYDDSKLINENAFLPFYWVPVNRILPYCDLDVCCIGTNHDGRYKILSKVKPQLEKANLASKISVCCPIVAPPHYYNLKKIKWKLLKQIDKIEYWNIATGVMNNSIIERKYYSIDEINNFILRSWCVLDTDREIQTGITPRVIWALALGKKIISTNENLQRMPFFNKNQIRIIDRLNPVIDVDFVKEKCFFEQNEYIQNLRIDKWVKKLL